MSLQNAYVRLNTKWSQMLGSSYTQYRPPNGVNPLASANQIGELPALFDASISLAFDAPNKFNNSLFAAICNPTAVRPLDYLQGAQGTFYIVSTEPLKPILCVQCARSISFQAPTPVPPSPGYYAGDIASARTPLLTNVPVSILNGTKGERNQAEQVPTDSRLPWVVILLPQFPGVILREGDHAVDDTGRNFVLSSCELTDLGWRLTAEVVDT